MKVLILEHDLRDVELLLWELEKGGLKSDFKVVDNELDFKDALCNFNPHIVLSGYPLPAFDGLSAFYITKTISPDIPFIIITASKGDEKAVEIIKEGVTDYVLKEKLHQIVPKIKKALKQANKRKEKRDANKKLVESEEKYRQLFQLSPCPMWVFDPETFQFLDVNDAAIRHYGYSLDEFLALTVKDIRPKEDVKELEEIVQLNKITENYYNKVFRHIKKNGELIHVTVESNMIDFQGKRARLVLATDITERITHLKAIEEQNRKLQEIGWMQSHIVRAPLARLMGLINYLDNYSPSEQQKAEMLNYILMSARELDSVIREIVQKTEKVNINYSNEVESVSGR